MSIPSDLPVHRGRVWRRATILIALCVTLALFASSDALHGALIELLAEIEAVIVTRPLLGVTLFVLFAAVSAMFTFVSVAAVVPVAVYTWGAPFSIVLLWTGWILGGIAAYAIGRYLGRPAIGRSGSSSLESAGMRRSG